MLDLAKKSLQLLTILLITCFKTVLFAGSLKYPVDISFLVADIKYSSESGVKICEIQQGSLSTFKGDYFVNGKNGTIASGFIKTLCEFQLPIWSNKYFTSDKGIQSQIKNHFEKINHSLDFDSNTEAYSYATSLVQNPYDISNYHGLIYARGSTFKDIDSFRLKFPGLIIIDAATYDYWIDKNKMSQLFTKNKELENFKPRWNLYPKKYTPDLKDQIISDLQCERFVIKPKNAFKGNGVIIVEKEDLDQVLNHITNKKSSTKGKKDPSYEFWAQNDDLDSFLVEEFCHSDPIFVPHLNGVYEPTIRVAFVLIYNNHSIQIEFCGAYNRLPKKSLDVEGTLNEKYKDAANAPFFAKIDPETYEKIKEELLIALPLLYKEMLDN